MVSKASSSSNHIVMDGGWSIDSSKLLPHYQSADNIACVAYSDRDPQQKFYAIVCNRDVNPRLGDVESYKSINHRCLPALEHVGIAFWPEDKQERQVFIYQDLGGVPLLDNNNKKHKILSEQPVLETVVPALVEALIQFQDKKITHGHINAHNIFYNAHSNQTFLGETLSLPYAYAQPDIYLTIEQIMAQKNGRACPTMADDIYALGVALAMLLRTKEDGKDYDSEKMVAWKMEHGTYRALIDKDRFKANTVELLRGLLHDNIADRWTMEEILLWQNGQRQTSKQDYRHPKADRPIVFLGKDYLYPRLFAMAIPESRSETERMVEAKEIPKWFERSFASHGYDELFQSAIRHAQSQGKGAGYQDKLASYISMTLDHDAPLRYKSLSLYPDGTANALFSSLSKLSDDRHDLADMLQSSMMLKWIAWRESVSKDYTDMTGKFDKCRMFLRHRKAGYGIERCLYYLDKNARCLSPLFDNFIVRDVFSMMNAFEALAKSNPNMRTFFDSHVSAYVSAHAPKLIESSLYDLDSADGHQKLISQLRILSNIQSKTSRESYPHIAHVFQKQKKSLLANYKDTKRIEKLTTKLDTAAAKGDLQEMYAIITNETDTKNDKNAYEKVRIQYQILSSENKALERAKDGQASGYKNQARHMTAMFACGISCVLIALTVIIKLTSQLSGF